MSGAMGGAAGGVGEATGTVGDSGADVRVHWVTAFLDRPVAAFALAADFWCAALGATLSARRGENGEFATLLPTDGDAAIKLQGVGDPCQGGHLDLEVPDVVAARDRAVGLGAPVSCGSRVAPGVALPCRAALLLRSAAPRRGPSSGRRDARWTGAR